MVDKEMIGIWRNELKSAISSWLLRTNYEGMGEQDKEEFERDFDEILDLALIGLKYKAQLSLEGTTPSAADAISRQAAIDEIMGQPPEAHYPSWYAEQIKGFPPAQPEITDEQAIEHLQESGWMQNHDKQMYETGLRERLADDSGSYDALLPSAQPEQDREFIKLTVRNSNGRPYYSIIYLVVDGNGVGHDLEGYSSYSLDVISDYLKKYFMPSVQPEIIRCKDCRYGVNFYRDGDCYCSNPKRELTYFGGSWEFYCADAERKGNGSV